MWINKHMNNEVIGTCTVWLMSLVKKHKPFHITAECKYEYFPAKSYVQRQIMGKPLPNMPHA